MTWKPGAGEMIIQLNQRNRITKLSQTVPSVLGRTRSSLEGLSIYKLMSGEDQDRLAEIVNYVRRSSRPSGGARQNIVRRLDLTLRPSEGVHLRCVARVQAGPRGAIDMLLHEAPPARESAEQENSVVQAQSGNAMPDNLMPESGIFVFDTSRLADLSHEMKTPLNAILGFSDAMRERTFGPLGDQRYQDYADHIYTSGEHLMGLVTSILDLAKLDADEYKLKPVLGNISDIVVECAEMVRQQSEKANLKLSIEPLETQDSLLDVQAVRQILINLLSNAVKFTSDGGIFVSIHQKPGQQQADVMADSMFEIVVRDTGIGMSAEQLAQLGERYTGVSANGVRGASGSGLGLALASSLAKVHGGSLAIESAPGEGVTATLTLPFTPVLTKSSQSLSAGAPVMHGASQGPREMALTVSENGEHVGGRPEALQTQMDRIDAYQRKLNGKRDASAA